MHGWLGVGCVIGRLTNRSDHRSGTGSDCPPADPISDREEGRGGASVGKGGWWWWWSGSPLAIRPSKVSAEPQTARRRLFASVWWDVGRVAAQVRPTVLPVSRPSYSPYVEHFGPTVRHGGAERRRRFSSKSIVWTIVNEECRNVERKLIKIANFSFVRFLWCIRIFQVQDLYYIYKSIY